MPGPTTDLELRHYLNSKSIPCHEVEALEGGTANFVWRISTLLGRKSIVKHAEAYVKSNRSLELGTGRMGFEARALEVLEGALEEGEESGDPAPAPAPRINFPTLHHHDPTTNILLMSDGGSRTLKAAYTDPALDIPSFGSAIGAWLANLHLTTISPELRSQFSNPVAKQIYRYSYANLASALDSQGFSRELGERVNEKYGSLLEREDGPSVCHGDFWPGNMLISDHPSPTDTKLTVVDWEMVRSGTGATDVGQFAAEAWLLDRTRGGRGLLKAFLEGYIRKKIKVSREEAVRVAVHFGTHLGFWPTRVEWGTEGETREIVGVGVEVLRRCEEGDWVGLGDGELGFLFRGGEGA